MPEINMMKNYSIEELNTVIEISKAQGCENRSCGPCVFNKGTCKFSLIDFTRKIIENEILKRVAVKEAEEGKKNYKDEKDSTFVADQVFLKKVNSSTFNKGPEAPEYRGKPSSDQECIEQECPLNIKNGGCTFNFRRCILKPSSPEETELPSNEEKEECGAVYMNCTFNETKITGLNLDEVMELVSKLNERGNE